MPLTQEAMLTREGISYSPTLKVDIYKMDEQQLREYIAANLSGTYFDAYPSISFLPGTANLSAGHSFAPTLADLYVLSANPQKASEFHLRDVLPKPFTDYIDPTFRTRLSKIIVEYLDNFAEEIEKPVSNYNNRNTFLGIIKTVSKILSFEGTREINPDHAQFLSPLKKIFENPSYKEWLNEAGMGVISAYLHIYK